MIIGWKSPLDGAIYGLEDFAAMERVIPEPLLRAMTHKVKTDTRHSGPNITITSGLSCPRKTLVTRMMDTTPDPTKMWKMHRGTWLHECIGLSLSENPEWITEEGDADSCTFEGEVFGVKMSCRIDARKRDFSQLIDWKFRGDGAEKWVDPMGRAKDEDSAQLNMARMLMEQTTGKDLKDMDMYVWVMSGQTIRTTVPYLSADQLGAIRPGGGNYTIREIFNMLDLSMKMWVSDAEQFYKGDYAAVPLEKKQAIVAALPMVGESMYQSKRKGLSMCTSYCEVRDACYACEGGI